MDITSLDVLDDIQAWILDYIGTNNKDDEENGMKKHVSQKDGILIKYAAVNANVWNILRWKFMGDEPEKVNRKTTYAQAMSHDLLPRTVEDAVEMVHDALNDRVWVILNVLQYTPRVWLYLSLMAWFSIIVNEHSYVTRIFNE